MIIHMHGNFYVYTRMTPSVHLHIHTFDPIENMNEFVDGMDIPVSNSLLIRNFPATLSPSFAYSPESDFERIMMKQRMRRMEDFMRKSLGINRTHHLWDRIMRWTREAVLLVVEYLNGDSSCSVKFMDKLDSTIGTIEMIPRSATDIGASIIKILRAIEIEKKDVVFGHWASDNVHRRIYSPL